MSIRLKIRESIRQRKIYMLFKPLLQVFFFSLLILLNGCIVQFIPETGEDQKLLVVEGMITDKPDQNTIKLSTSQPLGGRASAQPLTACIVTITDDVGNTYCTNEAAGGTYVTDPEFLGVVGRSYTLHVKTGESNRNLNYQSLPVLLKPVSPIDSIYYEKLVLSRSADGWPSGEGCQIYLNTYDPENSCKFFRWEFVETWEFTLPYNVPNAHCWTTDNSDRINIKNTTSLSEDRLVKVPLTFVSNETDRLKEKYSILVNQYSLNEDEYLYWEKLQKIVEQVGSLYDTTPASIPSNVLCVENPDAKVLGYFSVSSVKSKRIFIKDQFRGIINLYGDCVHKMIGGNEIPPGLGSTVWIIEDHQFPPPAYRLLTYIKSCADCTTRGTTHEPSFWKEDK